MYYMHFFVRVCEDYFMRVCDSLVIFFFINVDVTLILRLNRYISLCVLSHLSFILLLTLVNKGLEL